MSITLQKFLSIESIVVKFILQYNDFIKYIFSLNSKKEFIMHFSDELLKNEFHKLTVFSNILVMCERIEGNLKNPDIINTLKELFHILFEKENILDDQELMKVYRAQFSIDYDLLEAYECKYITDKSQKILAEKELKKYEFFKKLEKEYWNNEEKIFQKCLKTLDLDIQKSFTDKHD